MTTAMRVLLIAGSVLTALYVLIRIRRNKMQTENYTFEGNLFVNKSQPFKVTFRNDTKTRLFFSLLIYITFLFYYHLMRTNGAVAQCLANDIDAANRL